VIRAEVGSATGSPPYAGSMSGDAVRVEVLEALASAWEDQAKGLSRVKAVSIENCARMLREAIAHGGQG
jgi:hypothetical protein